VFFPSHTGITGNEKADQTAKFALKFLNITPYPPPYSDIKSFIENTYLSGGYSWHK